MTRQEFDALGYTNANNKWVNPKGLVQDKECYFWWMQQHQDEFFNLIEILSDRSVKTILEVGSSHGGTLPFFDKLVGPEGLIVGLDFSEKSAFSVQKLGNFQPTSKMILLVGDSHATATIDRVVKALDNRPLDFLFIDGDHTYEGCKMDFEMYSPLVRPGGLVGFHDVSIMSTVQQAFDEIEDYKTSILPVHYMGIGLAEKPTEQ